MSYRMQRNVKHPLIWVMSLIAQNAAVGVAAEAAADGAAQAAAAGAGSTAPVVAAAEAEAAVAVVATEEAEQGEQGIADIVPGTADLPMASAEVRCGLAWLLSTLPCCTPTHVHCTKHCTNVLPYSSVSFVCCLYSGSRDLWKLLSHV